MTKADLLELIKDCPDSALIQLCDKHSDLSNYERDARTVTITTKFQHNDAGVTSNRCWIRID